MKISVILKGSPDQQGRLPVVIRTADGDHRQFRATQIRVQPSQLQNGRIVKHPQATRYNDVIKKLVLEQETKIISGEKDIKPISFYTFALDEIRSWDKIKKASTLRQFLCDADKIIKFAPAINLTDITPSFLENLQTWMAGQGNEINTIWKTLKNLQVFMKSAKKKNLIKDNPFDLFAGPKYRNPQRIYLTTQQVELLDMFARETPSPQLAFCTNWFLIGCNTGLRYSDMHTFDEKKNIVGGRLIVHTVKTGEVVSIPLSEKIKDLFGRVGWKGLNYLNPVYNRYLKTIAVLAGVGVNLTAHVSRHTAAVMWANAGISQEVTAKLLGHTDLTTTAIYYKITGQRIDEELKKLQ